MENLPHTKEGLILAIYKMSVNNNALLKTVLQTQAMLYAKMQEIKDGIDYPSSEKLQQAVGELTESLLSISDSMESQSSKVAWDFAVEHDSNLDFDSNH